ncbi:aminotransferase class V-fold PLP-dependent enzyme [Lentzea sp. NBRC 105346]|uniref:aminotransferase class V-fold PLP-dependent enzyme n=1 Tax=Lentzea sp. NBRC 105346 TaxID=3032205 RepID=UPI002553D52B|nr:aminotransferase class V-fold PLP-dependent enzyme [Lentzea sp. NBRC 105346]
MPGFASRSTHDGSGRSPSSREAFGKWFDVAPGYLNTASIGVPPVDAVSAVRDALERWQRGEDRPSSFEPAIATARAGFAALAGVPVESVACGTTVSQLIGSIAATLRPGARVLVAAEDFTSVTLPFVAQGFDVTAVPLTELVSAVDGHDLVAVSVVQSADGRIADLDGLRACGVPVLLDVSQALGWYPLSLGWADFVVGVAYKWLMAPRGVAWLAVRPDRLDDIVPVAANWFSTNENYGVVLPMAPDARRLDLSPTWFAHTGAAVTLPWLASLDMKEVRDHCVGLADSLLAGLGLPPKGSAIVSLETKREVPRASLRAGRLRLAFHLFNTAEDVDLVLEALA